MILNMAKTAENQWGTSILWFFLCIKKLIFWKKKLKILRHKNFIWSILIHVVLNHLNFSRKKVISPTVMLKEHKKMSWSKPQLSPKDKFFLLLKMKFVTNKERQAEKKGEKEKKKKIKRWPKKWKLVPPNFFWMNSPLTILLKPPLKGKFCLINGGI